MVNLMNSMILQHHLLVDKLPILLLTKPKLTFSYPQNLSTEHERLQLFQWHGIKNALNAMAKIKHGFALLCH